MKKWNTVNLSYAGLMTSLAIILSFFPEIPLAFFAPWLKLDLSFVPMMLAGLSIGPVAGIAALLIANAVHLLGSTSAGVGELANVIVGASFLLPAFFAYRIRRTRKSVLYGMLIGIIMMVAAGVLSNIYILMPFYLGDGFSAFNMREYIAAAVIPFNLVKGVVDCAITYLLYKRLSGILKEASLENEGNNKQQA